MYRGYTFRLHPTAEQGVLFEQFAGVCRLVWNLALEQRREHWRRYQASTGDNLNFVTQSRELTKLRAEVDFVRAVPQACEQRTLKNLESAYQRAFKGLGGYPDYKRKGVGDAFSFDGRDVAVERINRRWGRVKMPKIGWVKFRYSRQVAGRITEAAITMSPLGWQVSIGCAIDGDVPDNGLAVGIDRGVAVPLMLSDGTSYSLPSSIADLERRYRKAQRVIARRKKGSKRRARAIKRAAAIKAKQARVRKHWAHCATTDITRRYSTVVIERLRTKSMTASARGTVDAPGRNVAAKTGLNRAILNVGWGQIETMLAYKASRVIKIDPAYTSQTCSACGVVDKLSRKNQAVFECTGCGHSENADRNAAKNIFSRGNTSVLDVEGKQSSAPFEASTIQVAA